jgi:hypothetical protein
MLNMLFEDGRTYPIDAGAYPRALAYTISSARPEQRGFWQRKIIFCALKAAKQKGQIIFELNRFIRIVSTYLH